MLLGLPTCSSELLARPGQWCKNADHISRLIITLFILCPYKQSLQSALKVKTENVLRSHFSRVFVLQHLRQAGIAGKFVEFFGPGVSQLSAPDRTTIANMCPEYNATVSFFPVDQVTLKHFKKTRESPDWPGSCPRIQIFFWSVLVFVPFNL